MMMITMILYTANIRHTYDKEEEDDDNDHDDDDGLQSTDMSYAYFTAGCVLIALEQVK